MRWSRRARPATWRKFAAAAIAAGLAAGTTACAARPQLIEEVGESGFAVYRSGRLDAKELGELCSLGVEEIVVLDGSAGERECRWRSEVCPGLKVRYNQRQDARRPPTRSFLQAFDHWVEESRSAGRKIAFRCHHGWHRTGRLAAYYRMRFMGWSMKDATDEMLESGRFMRRFPELQPQVAAMGDVLASRPCAQDPRHCPPAGQVASEGLVTTAPRAGFAADLCGQESP